MGIDSLTNAAHKVDDLVPPAAELGNDVLVDEHRMVRLAGPLFALFSLCMIPWIAFIAFALPSRQLAPNFDLAWVGFDGMLMFALAATAYFALRRSRYLSVAATSAATMLFVDAWFDVLTSRGADQVVAIVVAMLVELPLAALCCWLSQHSQMITEKRIALLLPRARGRMRRNAVKSKSYST